MSDVRKNKRLKQTSLKAGSGQKKIKCIKKTKADIPPFSLI